MSRGQGGSENCIGAELRFVRGSVNGQHCLVNGRLVYGIHAYESLGNFSVYVFDGLGDSFAEIA